MIQWVAIGDSFTYLNDHLDETGYRVSRGYLSRIADRIPSLQLHNIGINGSTFADWISQPIPKGDLYTVLLGTNDWHHGHPLGSEQDFRNRQRGTILGHLGILLDPENNAPGSYAPEHGLTLSDAAAAILKCCEAEGAATVDLHTLSGFTQDKLVKFKRLRQGETYADLPYPDYIGHPFHPGKDEYPYPIEAIALTYDGLHPSDQGCQILADLFADQIEKTIGG